MKEYIYQLLSRPTTLMDILGEPFSVALKLTVGRWWSWATRYRWSQVAHVAGMLQRSRRTSSTRTLSRRRGTSKEARTVRIEVLIRELLDEAIGAVVGVVAHVVGRLGRRDVLLAIWLCILGRLHVGVVHEIALSIGAVLSVHVVVRPGRLVNGLRKCGGGRWIGAVVRTEAIIVGEIEIKTVQVIIVAIGIHIDDSCQLQ